MFGNVKHVFLHSKPSIIFFCVLCVLTMYQTPFLDGDRETETKIHCSTKSLKEALNLQADESQTVIISLVDSRHLEMAINLYQGSYKKLGLKNFLFLSSDQEATQILEQHNIACVTYDSWSRTFSLYSNNSNWSALKKANMKSKIVLDILELGYNILMVNLDTVILKNPFPYFTCSKCDLEIQNDDGMDNTGFFLAKSTKNAKEAFKLIYEEGKVCKRISHQEVFDIVIRRLQKEGKLVFKFLSDRLFQSGKVFFENGHRFFAEDGPCHKCVIIRNNWITSKEAKIYRLKEIKKWALDWNMYYSNPNGRYLMYNNPLDFGKAETLEKELDALKNAIIIGHLLKRIVILPAFHCYGCTHACTYITKQCHLATHIKLQDFDKVFEGKYREHSFLRNEMVPSDIKDSVTTTNTMFIETNRTLSQINDTLKDDVIFRFKKESVIVSDDINIWFERFQNEPVLLFHSLYDVFDLKRFLNDNLGKPIATALQHGFQPANFRQFYT